MIKGILAKFIGPWRALATGVALAMGLFVPAGPALADFASQCAFCHGMTGGRVNAANAVSVIERANGANSMYAFGTNVSAIASEIAAALTTPADTATVFYTSGTTATSTVAYGGTRLAVVPNIVLGGVLNTLSQTSGHSGVSFSGTTLIFAHPGGAGGNCTTRAINVVGTGPSGDSDPGAGVTNVTPTTSTRTITISITPPAAPTAANDSTSIAYSTSATTINLATIGAVTGTVRATGTTPGLGTPSPNVGSVAGTGPESLTYSASGTTYAPTVDVAYSVTGPCSTTSVTRTLTINVGLPPAPVVTNLGSAGSPQLVPANVASVFNLAGNISGVVASNPAGTYNLNAVSASVGTAVASGNSITFTPPMGFTGTATVTFTKDGPGGTSNVGTIFINVTAAPVVTDATATTAFNTAVPVNLAANITGTVTSVAVSGAPVNGTALATGPTTITFTPTAGFFGTGSFQYTATGPGGTSTVATVTVTVNPPPPTAGNFAATVAYNSGAPVQATGIDVTPNVTGAPFTSVSAFGAVNGSVSVAGSIVSFTPTVGYIGPASFQYTASNAGGVSNTATVTVTVSGPPPPVAGSFSVLVSGATPTTINLAPYITGLASSASIVGTPGAGTVSVSGFVLTYTPQAGVTTGTYVFSYRATGVGGNSNVATVTLTYTMAPVTADRTLSVPFDGSASIDLQSAFAGVIDSFTISRQPANGSISLSGTTVTYTPRPGFFGTDSFQFQAVGPGGTSVPGTVTITVNPPVASVATISAAVPFNTPTTINLGAAVTGVATAISITANPSHGTLVVTGLTAVYTPRPGYSGSDSFSFAAVNASGVSTPAIVNVTVGTLRPAAGGATMLVPLNGSGTIDLAPFITGSSITGVAISTSPSRGTVDVNGTRVTYTPRRDFFGTDTFTYQAFGNAGSSSSVVVSVTVVGRPDPAANPNVAALVEAQAQAAKRFAAAQVANVQRRMESLHHPVPSSFSTPAEASPAPAAPASSAPARPPGTYLNGRNGSAATAPPPRTSAQVPNPLSGALAGTLVGAGTRSLDLGAVSSGLAEAAPGLRDGLSVWIGGSARFGTLDSDGQRSGSRFNTDGVTVGVDRRFGDRLALGVGFGYARDETDLGSDGSRSKADGSSFSLYGSFHPWAGLYVDALVGYGRLELDSQRFVEPVGGFATGRRNGRQAFGSVAAGYEWRRDGILFAPYARLDATSDRLDGMAEGGVGLYALAFREQKLRSTQAALGFRVESQHESEFGWISPRARVEYRRDLENDRRSAFNYADLTGVADYVITSAAAGRNSLAFGIGADLLWKRGLRMGFDYQAERASGSGNNQGVRVMVSQVLDGKGWQGLGFEPVMFKKPITVDVGYAYDDNVSRGRLDGEKRTDNVFSLGVSQTWTFALASTSRLLVTGMINGEKFRRHDGLGHVSPGLQAEAQYRRSGAFDAPTWSLIGRATYDEYQSRLRSGERYYLGVGVRRALTDRIELYGEVGGNVRRGKSKVFQQKDVVAKANVDYSLGRRGTVYMTGEYRQGEAHASGIPSLVNSAISDFTVPDDAFTADGLFAYRVDGRTGIGTLGWNYPLGARDSVDFSWRHVYTTPRDKPAFDFTGPLRYIDNQYFIAYLMRF